MAKTKNQPEEAEPSEADQYKMVRQLGSSKRLKLGFKNFIFMKIMIC